MKNKRQILRFGMVGGANTAIDFGALFLLKWLGLPVITSNIISTTIAFCFSFVANKKFTFKTTGTNVRRELLLFILVTLFGLWVLQSGVIVTVQAAIAASGVQIGESMSLFAAKIIATIVSLVWNYLLYAKVVFQSKS